MYNKRKYTIIYYHEFCNSTIKKDGSHRLF
nr:MAG TPA: hypothetical protein [Caudoviricetes sp.]